MKNQPVLAYASIGAAVSAVIMLGLSMSVSLGWLTLDIKQMGSIEAFVGAVIALGTLIAPPLIGAWLAGKKVTPVAHPRMPDGQPAALVPLSQFDNGGERK